MNKAKFTRRIVIFSLSVFLAGAVALVYLVLRPDIATQIFLSADPSPVNIRLRTDYQVPVANDKTSALVIAAKGFLDSLNVAQRQAIQYSFSDNAQRSNWSNFPEGMVPRGGIRIGGLSYVQQKNLDRVLKEFLSEDGVENIAYQLAAEDLLIRDDLFSIMKYGSEYFYVAFLGEPSTTEPWMFQFGGHHLALNITVFGSRVSYSPMLTGGQPMHLQINGEDVFINYKESAAAHAFIASLSLEQKREAVIAEQPIDLVLGPGKYGKEVVPAGIKGSDLSETQKSLLLNVIQARLGFINEFHYTEKLKIIETELEDTYFGWWGPQDIVGAAYFRVTSPSIVIEYANQDGEESVDHVHSMYRDVTNDYGSAWIGVN